MKKYNYKIPHEALGSAGFFKNPKQVAAFIRRTDKRFKGYSTKELVKLCNIN